MANRSAWGRKGRIALQIFGSKGAILFDQERMNEYQLYVEEGGPAERGFRTVLTAPRINPMTASSPLRATGSASTI